MWDRRCRGRLITAPTDFVGSAVFSAVVRLGSALPSHLRIFLFAGLHNSIMVKLLLLGDAVGEGICFFSWGGQILLVLLWVI